ncbi:MAG TPA: SIS domain-containing protein [Anaerolineaceae bacterium]|nr:SIS domain-containing protein [Anaerolineaceae bacterium]
MSLRSEIFEQPDVLEGLLSRQMDRIQEIAAQIRRQDVEYAVLAARGTSDNAGRYANYVWGAYNRLPVALATPSLYTFYQKTPRLRGALVVGISQSGHSPDIVSVVADGKRQGCPTLAITNDPASPLAQAADFVLDIQAGPEIAVAATKTYTASLMGIAMLSACLAADQERLAQLRQVPEWTRQALLRDAAVSRLSLRYTYMQRCVVLGRGFNYATTFEWALKMKELAYVEAEPYSSADFLHGPIAMVERGFPVMAVAPDGGVYATLAEVLQKVHDEQLANLTVISNRPEALALAESPIPLPAGIPEWLSPIVAIIPGQLFAYHLTRHKGYDPEAPRSIHKVTETE